MFTVHSRSGRLAWRSTRSTGSAVVTTSVSSATMKRPSEVRASVQPLCGTAPARLPAVVSMSILSSSVWSTSDERDMAEGTGLDADLIDAPPQEAPLRLGAGELERTLEGGAGLIGTAEPAQQLGTRGVEVPVTVEVEAVDEGEAGLG